MDLKIITINLSPRQVKALEVLQELGLYPSRSEAIRVAIRDFLFEKYLGTNAPSASSLLFEMNDSGVKDESIDEKKSEIARLLTKLGEEFSTEA